MLLGTLNSERFVDTAPAAVHATLLDEGHYLGSVRTMYRLLAANGGCHERRNQRRHPVYSKPELLAVAPNQVWSWDITKLKGPAKWTCLPPLRDARHLQPSGRRLDGRLARKCRAGRADDCRDRRPPRHRARQVDPARRSRGQHALQAGGSPAGRSRYRQEPQPAPRLRRQPFLRSAVQDHEIPTRLPAALRQPRGCARPLPGILHLVQHRSTVTPASPI